MKLIHAFLLITILARGIAAAEDKTDIKYGQAGDVNLLLDAHVPDGQGPFPVVLIVHGGGWGTGDKQEGMAPFYEPLNRAGNFTWFSINYRLAPTNRWPACFEDVQTAIHWVKSHASEYKGDPHRLALMGYSAGGHLVCLAAVLAKPDAQVQAVVGFAPVTDLVADTVRRGGLSKSLQALLALQTMDDTTQTMLKMISPIRYARPGLPPFLLIQGDADKTVPLEQTINFQAKLKESGVSCDLITVKGAPHRIADWDKIDASYKDKMVAWLDRTLHVPARSTSAPTPVVQPDTVVATDGSGDFKTIEEAINALPRTNDQRRIIFIKDGVYHEKVRVDPDFVTLRGESRQGTRIEFSQGNDAFTNQPDEIGRAVININGSDFVLENLTVQNTEGIIGPHAFAVFGQADKTVIVDCNIWSDGADTLALGKGLSTRSYQARLDIRGSVDFVCPRGWSYMTDCTLHQLNPKADATIWHDGAKDADMKFVLRNCRFDGADSVPSWILARHHHDAQFFLLNCAFSKTLSNRPPLRVIYPLDHGKPTKADKKKNEDLNASNLWGERAYFYNCHRDGGDYPWHRDNLSSATNSPGAAQITAAWTFAGKWDPERHDGPTIKKIIQHGNQFEVVFSESVTVKGKPRLGAKSTAVADYISGSGTSILDFAIPSGNGAPVDVDLNGGAIIASEAGASLRPADLSLPHE